MAKIHVVKRARKDYPEFGIKKNERYYWYKHSYQPKIRTKTKPTPKDLTRSDFLDQYFKLTKWNFDPNNLEGSIDKLVSEILELQDECEDKLENMPEQLQYTSKSGQILQDRINSLGEWKDNILHTRFNMEQNFEVNTIIQDLEACDPGID